jgi:hypothetical protein
LEGWLIDYRLQESNLLNLFLQNALLCCFDASLQHCLTSHRLNCILQALAAACVVGKLLEISFFSCARKLHGSCQQHMLLHGVLLLLVHQDPLQQYLQQLALVVLAYGSCHLWLSGSATAAQSAAEIAASGSSAAAEWASAAGVNSSGSSLLQLGALRWNSSSDSLLALTTSGEFFVNAFMLLLLLHHVYRACVGPREQQSSSSSKPHSSGRRSRAASATGSTGVACSVAGSAVLARDKFSSSQSTGAAQPAEAASKADKLAYAAAAAVAVSDVQQQFNRCIWRVEEAPPLLNAAYVSKLAVVKLSNAAFVALYSLQCLQHAQSALAVQLGGFMFNPCHIGLVSVVKQSFCLAAVLLCSCRSRCFGCVNALMPVNKGCRPSNYCITAVYLQQWLIVTRPGYHHHHRPDFVLWYPDHEPVLVCLLQVCASVLCVQVLLATLCKRLYVRYARVINAAAMAVCLATRLLLVQLHGLIHARSCTLPDCSSSSSSTAGSVSPAHMFHSFLMLAFSLSANEEAWPAFCLQLVALTLLYRHMHLAMAVQRGSISSAVLSFGASYLLELPEYYAVAGGLIAAYKWVCVGMLMPLDTPELQQKAGGSQAGSKAGSAAGSRSHSRRCSSTGQATPVKVQGTQQANGPAAAAGTGVARITPPVKWLANAAQPNDLPEVLSGSACAASNQAAKPPAARVLLRKGSSNTPREVDCCLATAAQELEGLVPSKPGSSSKGIIRSRSGGTAANVQQSTQQLEGLRARSAGCAGQMLGSRAGSMHQLRAALQAAAADDGAATAAAVVAASRLGIAEAAGTGGCWYTGDAGTCDATEPDASAKSPIMLLDDQEAEVACRKQQQQQQQAFLQATPLPRWTKQDLQQLRRTSFDIPVGDLGSYSAAASAVASNAQAAAAEAVAAAAAAAAAVNSRMPSPGLSSAGNSGALLRRRFGSACDLRGLSGRLQFSQDVHALGSALAAKHNSSSSSLRRQNSAAGLSNSGPLPQPIYLLSQQQQQQQQLGGQFGASRARARRMSACEGRLAAAAAAGPRAPLAAAGQPQVCGQ